MTTSNCFETSALSLLLSQNATEQAILEATKVTVKVTGSLEGGKSKGKKLVAKRTVEATPAKPGVPGLSLPAKGTLTATQFMLAIRDAGKRVFYVSQVTDPTTGKVSYHTGTVNVEGSRPSLRVEACHTRNDTILAIAGYCGYDPMVNFGAQEIAARAKANHEIAGNKRLGGPTVAEARSAARSLAGLTNAAQGAPDTKAVRIANLKAQAVVYTDALIAHMHAGNEAGALAETARIEAIHADIALLGG